MRQPLPAASDPFDVLSAATPPTADQAKSLLDRYATLTSPERDAVIRKHHTVGAAGSGLMRWLAAVTPADMKPRRGLVSDILERVQRDAAEQTAGKGLAELGAAQAAFMEEEARQKALAEAAEEAKRTGAPPPTTVAPADVTAAHDREVKRTSPLKSTSTNAWDILPDADKTKWNARAAAVIAKVVKACNDKAPALGITAANLKWAPREIAEGTANVFARSGDPITFGMSFVLTAEADPEYVVRVVVHEIAGHPDFGIGRRSYEAQIYAEALRQKPNLGEPWDTVEERGTFAYIGTETYAALREVPFEKSMSPAHAGLGNAIEPEANIDNKLALLKSKYAPGLGEALLQGLYERFRVDPRISQEALALFERLARKHFGKVLKGVPDRPPWLDFGLSAGAGLEQAGGRSMAFTTLEASIIGRWTNTSISAGLRLEVPFDNKDAFVRAGLVGTVNQRLFGSLYGELRAGGVLGFGGATSGGTVGAGLSYDFGPAQLGLVYDFLKAADENDPNAHRAFLRLGARF